MVSLPMTDDFSPAIEIDLGEPIRIIDESETKTFRCVGTVLAKVEGDEFLWVNPVRVQDSCSRDIGCVVLHEDGNFIEGEFFLDYYTPERLNLETGAHKLHPRINTKKLDDSLRPHKAYMVMSIALVESAIGDPL